MPEPAKRSQQRARTGRRAQNPRGQNSRGFAQRDQNPRGQQRRPRSRNGGSSPRSGAGAGQQHPDRQYEQELDAALNAVAEQSAQAPATDPRGFADFDLPARLVRALARRGMSEPFAIQSHTLPDAIAGRDILGRAQTGSGKTLAFGIPMLARLADEPILAIPGKPSGLVLVPTRELAQQVTDALAPLARKLDLVVTSVYGGASMQRQISALRSGVDLVVATPGRLIDLNEQGEVDLGGVRIAVLDEADHMADLGFLPAVTRILDLTPTDGQRMLFSATLDRGVAGLVQQYLTNPAFHAVAAAAAPVESVDHKTFVVSFEDKVPVAAEIAGRPGRTLFFVRTKHGADRLAKQLGRAGVTAAAIHGNLKQGARRRALDGFAAGSPRVLVATDVAARGIHVEDVDLVVHFDPTEDPKDYLHRSGRTARAGATGTVISLALPDQRRKVADLHRLARVNGTIFDVRPGDPAVKEVATSGTPIVVREFQPRAASSDRARTGGSRRRGAPRPAGERRGGGQGRPQGRPQSHGQSRNRRQPGAAA